MDFISGAKVTSLTPLTKIDIDGCGLAEELFRAYLQQILVDGFFHADRTPGMFSSPTTGGSPFSTSEWSPHRAHPARSTLKVGDRGKRGKGEERPTRSRRSGNGSSYDERELRRRIGELVGSVQHTTVSELQMGHIVMELSRLAGECASASLPS